MIQPPAAYAGLDMRTWSTTGQHYADAARRQTSLLARMDLVSTALTDSGAADAARMHVEAAAEIRRIQAINTRLLESLREAEAVMRDTPQVHYGHCERIRNAILETTTGQ